MNDKPVELYLIGSITGFLGSALMLILSYLFIFRVQAVSLGTPDLKLVGITNGLGVVSLILIVPTMVALFALLSTVATARGFLGAAFALLWICIEIVGYLSQTAPLRTLNELYSDPSTRETAMSIYRVSEEFWEALSRTGAFFSVLMSLCYGLAFIAKWNRPAGYLFLLSILAFPIGMLIPNLGVHLHIALRGLAFFIVAGVLIKVAMSEEA